MPDVPLTPAEEKGQLPPVCMCCGAPAADWIKRSFPLHAPVVQGPSGFAEIHALRLLFAAANVPRVKLRTSFCAQHRHYWNLRFALQYGGLAGMIAFIVGGLALVVLLLAVFKIDAPWLGGCAIFPFLIYTIPWLIASKYVQNRTILVALAKDGSETLLLCNVDPRYRAALEQQRGGPASAATPLPTAVPADPRSSPALPVATRLDDDTTAVPPRPRPRPRGKKDQNAILIAALVGVPFTLLVLLTCLIKIGTTVDRIMHQRREALAERPLPPIVAAQPEAKREVDRAVEPGTVVPNVPVAVPPPPELKTRPSIDLIPLLNPRKDVVHGHWLVVQGALHCNEGSFVPRMQFPYLPPAEYDFVVTFTQPGLRNGVSLIMPNPHGGSFVWYVGSDNGAGYGLYGNPAQCGRRPGLITPHTIHTTKVEVRKGRVRTLLDGQELVNAQTDFRDMPTNDWQRLHDTRFPAVACDDPAVFYYVRIIEVTGHGKKAR